MVKMHDVLTYIRELACMKARKLATKLKGKNAINKTSKQIARMVANDETRMPASKKQESLHVRKEQSKQTNCKNMHEQESKRTSIMQNACK